MQNNETWVQSKWRPFLAYCFGIIILFDYVLGPVGWTAFQAYFDGNVAGQWAPLTQQGGGTFYVAMGAILGVTAWSRGQEKIKGVAGK